MQFLARHFIFSLDWRFLLLNLAWQPVKSKTFYTFKTLNENIYPARMTNLVRTNSENKDFQLLVAKLDAFLKITDGSEHAFYNQFNKIVSIKHAVVIYENNIPVGCGAIKHYGDDVIEVKRMYVETEYRGKGIASIVLLELENWSKELNYKKCILETGKKQMEAIALYVKNNYSIIKSYGQYENVANSVCFEKELA